MTLKQAFQKLGGTMKTSTGAAAINGRLRGDQISFTAGGVEFAGRVNGDTIEGTVTTAGKTNGWKATRG